MPVCYEPSNREYIYFLYILVFFNENNCLDTEGQPVLRIRNKSFQSGFGSGSGLKLVPHSYTDPNPDSNPDPKPGFGSRSETD